MAQNGQHHLVQVEERDNLGNTPLHYAIERGDKDSVELLLRNGANNANSANKKGYTPLHYICKRKHNNGMAEIFFECNDKINQPVQIDAQNELGKTPLHLASFAGNRSVAELLLRRGADPNLVDWLGCTPLHIIIKHCYNDDFIELFFNISEKKHRLLHVNVQDYMGNTPLHLALHQGNLKLVALLLRNGSDPNLSNAGGLTPLHYAVANLSPHVVSVLLNHGANVSSFVFPTVSQFIKRFNKWNYSGDYFKLELRSGVLAVTERLEDKGYELDRDAAITIIKLFANNKLCERWISLNESDDGYDDKYWLDDPIFTRETKEVMIIPDLSLYDLIQLRPEEAEKRLTYMDYLELARSPKWETLSKIYSSFCIKHVSEKLSRGVFRRWALDSFSELIHNRLPILCCEKMVDHLSNKDFWSIYLANCDLSFSVIDPCPQ